MRTFVRIGLACSIALSAVRAVRAQTVEPDRPDVTNGTHIVDTGMLQVEVGGLYTHAGPRIHALGSPLSARVGLFEWLEVRVENDGLVSQIDMSGRRTSIGNTQLGAKLRLWADPGGIPVLSILPSVTLPTANTTKGFGSGDADYALAVLTGSDLGRHAHVDVNYGIALLGAGSGRPHVAQHLTSLSASVAASDNWNPYIEAFWISRQDADTGEMTGIDAGAIYELGSRLALDGGVQIGLGPDAPGIAAFGGVSILVGDILGAHGLHARQRQAQRRAARKRP